ncbi:MAG: transcription antitermination factor NusB [Desulfobacca sp.]|uniref:transcription antitermination factor NusB n=1 Tax=Desulfobacca sp. TaxID=2067990 RepID=UPI00404961BB
MVRLSKSLARERALQCLYQLDVGRHPGPEAAALIWEHFHADEKPSVYCQRLIQGVWSHREELDAYISRFSQHWRLERLAAVDRAILRLALFELLYCPEVPPKVAINEAVDLAKRFGGEQSGAFINGILDRVLQTRQTPTTPQGAEKRKEG